MTIHQLDFMFPFLIFGYGLIMTFILNSQFFLKLAQEHLPQKMYAQYSSHKTLGFVCLVVGALWSLQNIWIGS